MKYRREAVAKRLLQTPRFGTVVKLTPKYVHVLTNNAVKRFVRSLLTGSARKDSYVKLERTQGFGNDYYVVGIEVVTY